MDNDAMVERVARALFSLDAPNGDADEPVFHPHDDLQTPKWKLYERQAATALEASHHAELVEVARVGLFYMREALAGCGNNHEAAEAVEADILRAERVIGGGV